jgi:tetratricopeptide (TPR) repeat protein
MQALIAAESQIQSGRFEAALDLFRDTNDKAWVAIALRDLGWFTKSHETPSKLAFLEESLSLSRELGYITGIIEASKQLGALELRQGHFEAAHQRLSEGFSLWQAHTADLGNSIVLSYELGDLAFYEGDYDLAQKHYEDSLAWAIQRGEQFSVGWSQVRLGYAALRRGQLQAAYQLFRQALLSFPATGMDFVLEGLIYTIEGLASLAVTQAEYDKAVRLLARADDNRKSRDVPRAPVEQAAVERDVAIIRSQLDDAAFEQEYHTGCTMTMDQAIKYALEETNA